MPSDQLLAELNDDPRTKAYRAERLQVWAQLRLQHVEYIASAEKNGASESAAELAADLHVRGAVNHFIGEMLMHSRASHAVEFLTEAPKGWGSRSGLLIDLDSLVTRYVAWSYHIPALNINVASLSAVTADDPVTWRAWLEKLMGQLGAAKLASQVFDPKANDSKSPWSPDIGPAKPTPPPPKPADLPAPVPAPTPAPASPWVTALAVGGGLAVGALALRLVARVWR